MLYIDGVVDIPELPDIVLLAQSMNEALQDRRIIHTTVNQPKCLNRPVASFKKAVNGRIIQGARQRGKWVLTELDHEWVLALNLGMGGEIRLHSTIEIPDPKRERVTLLLDTGEQLWIHHWWFGHVHLIPPGKNSEHPQLGVIGPEPLDDEFTVHQLATMLEGKRGRIKSYLLDQKFIAGIGNVYIQDILWHANLHPNRKANSLSQKDLEKLHWAIQHVLKKGIRLGPGPGEQDIWGNRGMWGKRRGWPSVGYQTGKPCPTCKTLVTELRVGSTTSYICPKCQI